MTHGILTPDHAAIHVRANREIALFSAIFNYAREIPLAGPAYLVYRFQESTN